MSTLTPLHHTSEKMKHKQTNKHKVNRHALNLNYRARQYKSRDFIIYIIDKAENTLTKGLKENKEQLEYKKKQLGHTLLVINFKDILQKFGIGTKRLLGKLAKEKKIRQPSWKKMTVEQFNTIIEFKKHGLYKLFKDVKINTIVDEMMQLEQQRIQILDGANIEINKDFKKKSLVT
eukprot:247546_1